MCGVGRSVPTIEHRFPVERSHGHVFHVLAVVLLARQLPNQAGIIRFV